MRFTAFLFFLSLGLVGFASAEGETVVSAPSIRGPVHSSAGQLVVFETDFPADWIVAPLDQGAGSWAVDSSGNRLYFASAQPGVYTVLAAVVVESKPVVLSAVFYNGTTPPSPPPGPGPTPEPVPNSLVGWVRAEAGKIASPHQSREQIALAECFAAIAAGIERRTIKSPQAARALFRQGWNAKAAGISPTTLSHWADFLEGLGERIQTELGDQAGDVAAMRRVYEEIDSALRETVSR